jgi:CRISPR system Cascade subunit CasB
MNDKHSRFIQYLSKNQEDRQRMAVFRRSLSQPPGMDIGPYRYIGRFLNNNKHPAADWLLCLIAGLYALAPSEPGESASFGATLAEYCKAKPGAQNGIERRLTALLNAHSDDLPQHLRHAVALLKQSEQRIDWVQLTTDLQHWNSPKRAVQRTWARDFWGAVTPLEESKTNKKDQQTNEHA